jgi:subtilisin family serine protease
VVLRGRDIVDGRLHAWIERDASGRYQSRFPRSQATSQYTTNTICNCFRAIAVGAHDATRRDRPPTRFSSRGPTADGRQKPELSAPGYKIRAARSLPRRGWRPGESRLCVKSGTSMAAPWVSGTVALMFAAAGRPLTIHELRRALIGSLDPHPGPPGRSSTRLGYGYLNTAAAVAAARRIGQGVPLETPRPALREAEDDMYDSDEMAAWAPISVEDASQLQEYEEDEQLEVVADEDVRAPSIAIAECGCGGSLKRQDAEQDTEDDEDYEDTQGRDVEDWFEDSEAESAAVPLEWEDVVEALEEFEENESLSEV